MLSAYVLIADFSVIDADIDEEQFQELISSSLSYLNALQGSFDRKSCIVIHYPPSQRNEFGYWGCVCLVTISIGKQRAENLLQLYRAVANLIEHELPACLQVKFDIDIFRS